jgi:hypothetical protein
MVPKQEIFIGQLKDLLEIWILETNCLKMLQMD